MKFSKLNYFACSRLPCQRTARTRIASLASHGIDTGEVTVQFSTTTLLLMMAMLGKLDEWFVVLYVTVSDNEEHLNVVFLADEFFHRLGRIIDSCCEL